MEFIHSLLSLWVPILLSAAAVWVISIVFGMALPHHKKDWIGLTGDASENEFVEYLRRSGIKPGNYLFPDFRTSAQLKSEKVEHALAYGPVGHLSVWKTPVTMGDKMIGSFVRRDNWRAWRDRCNRRCCNGCRPRLSRLPKGTTAAPWLTSLRHFAEPRAHHRRLF